MRQHPRCAGHRLFGALKSGFAFVAILVGLPGGTLFAAPSETIDFRADWRFEKGDTADAEATDFDDSKWSVVRLPHDWAIAGPVDPKADGATGKLPWRGVGWYRKTLNLKREPWDRVYLDFDGVMAFPQVYVNGQLAGEWDYGYTSFRIDATPYVKLDGENVVAVRVDTTKHVSRWYPGAGIYRKVMLQLRGPVHIGHWGVFVTTPDVTDEAATANITADVANHHDKPVDVAVRFEIRGPNDDTVIAEEVRNLTLRPGANNAEVSLKVPNPKRWDVDCPNLYRLTTAVLQGDSVIDRQLTTFGIRTVELTADDGLHLNGRRVQLQGVNLHHDHGPLGAAFHVRAMERQLEIMRDMGVNAIRTSHNPPAPELLDLCDRIGLLVWDEAFDKWDGTADRVDGKPSHQQHAERHLPSVVKRDRNHPSVVVWSIGNEISAGGEGVTAERIKMMRRIVREHDPTRPVGLGCHIPEQARTALLADLDFTGWNYTGRYREYRTHFPDKPIIYSESASALSTRGFYELPLPKTKTDYSKHRQVNSYDFNAAAWSDIADVEFALMERDRFVAGEFVWTGFDYLGEPTPFEKEAKSSYFGIVDLCGIPKDRFYLYRSYWRPDEATVHILPHWNWPDRVGKPVPVFVYTNGDEAELFLNGKSLGRRRKGDAPPKPTNFAKDGEVVVRSEQPNNPSEAAVDDDENTRWCAASASPDQSLQVDLGEARSLKCLMIEFEREAKEYGYTIETSEDGKKWSHCTQQAASDQPPWGGPRTAVHDVEARGRYVRVRFDELRSGAWASVRELQAFPVPAESAYYDVTHNYRLRWKDVAYEPGMLEAIAYKDGKRIGDASVHTASEPASIQLTPDRTKLDASGDDLCFVLVEALDRDGNPCPLAENSVSFKIDGPATIAGVGNGDPLSAESFQSDDCRLFYGKAMLILRTLDGKDGTIGVKATSDGLRTGEATVEAAPSDSL